MVSKHTTKAESNITPPVISEIKEETLSEVDSGLAKTSKPTFEAISVRIVLLFCHLRVKIALITPLVLSEVDQLHYHPVFSESGQALECVAVESHQFRRSSCFVQHTELQEIAGETVTDTDEQWSKWSRPKASNLIHTNASAQDYADQRSFRESCR